MDPVRPAKGRNKNSDKMCSKILTIYRESHIRDVGLRHKIVQTIILRYQVSLIKDGMHDDHPRVIYHLWETSEIAISCACNLHSTGQQSN